MSDSAELHISGVACHGDFRLELDERLGFDGVTGLFGASGSGKTTLLRAIAGLDRQFEGLVSFAGDLWQDAMTGRAVPVWRRSIGYVFQQPALFPHLNVHANLDYAIRRRSDRRTAAAFADVVDALNVGKLLDREVTDLSGGEQQRVAMARALLSAPGLMLLDEPLSALDQESRNEILPYLETLLRSFAIPALYVSHSVPEIARLANHVVVLQDGRVTGRGDVHELLGDVRQLAMGGDEPVTVLDVTITDHDESLLLTRVRFGTHELTLPGIDLDPGEGARILVRSGDVVVATEAPAKLSVRNALPGNILDIDEFDRSPFAVVTIGCNGTNIFARLTRHAVNELELRKGNVVYALIKTATFDRGL